MLTVSLSISHIAPVGVHCQIAGTGDWGSYPPYPLGLSTGLPSPGYYWCLPPSIVPRVLLGCHDIEWGVRSSLFTSLRFHCGTKGFCPVWGVTTLYTTLECLVVALRCFTEVSSLMFQVPLWTSTKAREYPL